MDAQRSIPRRSRAGGGSFDIGQRIRDVRKHKGLTLEQVAEATELSVGFLSQVERNITRPSLASLATIARVLGTTVSALLHQPDLPTAVSRRDGRVAYVVKESTSTYERLSTSFPSQMLNAVKVGVPGRFVSRLFAFEGETVVYVLSGTVRYIIDGVIYELQEGDSLHFSNAEPHQVTNPTDMLAEMLIASTQQFYDDQHRVLPQLLVPDPDPGRKRRDGG